MAKRHAPKESDSMINLPQNIIDMMRQANSPPVDTAVDTAGRAPKKIRKTYHLSASTPVAVEALLADICAANGLDENAITMGAFADFVIRCGIKAIKEGQVDLIITEQTVRQLKL